MPYTQSKTLDIIRKIYWNGNSRVIAIGQLVPESVDFVKITIPDKRKKRIVITYELPKENKVQ